MFKHYINGKMVEGAGELIEVVAPATGKIIATYKAVSEEQAQEALEAAQAAYKTWQFSSMNERTEWMMKLKAAIAEHREEIVDLIAEETGRAWRDNVLDFNNLLSYFDFFNAESRRVYDVGLTEQSAHRDSHTTVYYRALGVVVGHLAWNVPLLNFGVKLCPAVFSGCATVLKPSTDTPLATMRIGEIAAEIGFPAGVFNIVSGKSSTIGKYLNESKIPAMITCIGSIATGVRVMQQSATSIKRLSLELGANNPCIIMPDADIDYCVEFVGNRKVVGSGQGCGNINRIFVHESIHDEFVEKLLKKVKSIKIGYGKDKDFELGSQHDLASREKVLNYVNDAVERGAKLLYGGVPAEMPEEFKGGAFMIPAILDEVTDDMPVVKEEHFGPIYPILTFKTLDEVIERANNTEYGLMAYAFSHDSRAIHRFVEELECGKMSVNDGPLGDPNIPHSGHKQSGIGAVFSKWSLEEYYSIKCASVKP